MWNPYTAWKGLDPLYSRGAPPAYLLLFGFGWLTMLVGALMWAFRTSPLRVVAFGFGILILDGLAAIVFLDHAARYYAVATPLFHVCLVGVVLLVMSAARAVRIVWDGKRIPKPPDQGEPCRHRSARDGERIRLPGGEGDSRDNQSAAWSGHRGRGRLRRRHLGAPHDPLRAAAGGVGILSAGGIAIALFAESLFRRHYVVGQPLFVGCLEGVVLVSIGAARLIRAGFSRRHWW